MRALLLVFGLIFLVACLPAGPTGHATAPPTHFQDGSQVLISASVDEPTFGVYPVRITVFGDRVYPTVLVNGEEHTLAGPEAGRWLMHRGSRVFFLPEGEHTIHAFSCLESFWGWKCGCRSADDCGHWMQRSVIVG